MEKGFINGIAVKEKDTKATGLYTSSRGSVVDPSLSIVVSYEPLANVNDDGGAHDAETHAEPVNSHEVEYSNPTTSLDYVVPIQVKDVSQAVFNDHMETKTQIHSCDTSKSWGRMDYARALIDIRVDWELKEDMVIAIPNVKDDREVIHTVRVKYE
ncbi:hypothetical protein Tco_0979560 [Tanacetum coccineum]